MQTTITLSADDDLIEAARTRAKREQTTLDEQFRHWLEDYAECERRSESERAAERKLAAERAMTTIRDLQKYVRTEGRKFTRDEMNER